MTCAVVLPFAVGCSNAPREKAPGETAQATPAAALEVTSKPAAAPATGDPAWHYEGEAGPATWGTLSPKFAACGEGKAQSPIDIPSAATGSAPALRLQFPAAALRIAHHEHVADGINNGHTIQINYDGADTLTIGDQSYALAQYHFHAPSEHTLDGKPFPMEMHMVHKSADDKLAVVGVFIAEGSHNAAFDPVWANLPKEKGVEVHYSAVSVDVDRLLPAARTSYRYDGSLTTPPCSEGVKWVVMTTPVELSGAQIKAFTTLVHDNNRPTQPLNGRTVATDKVSESR
jgi:carbonic anhydrase